MITLLTGPLQAPRRDLATGTPGFNADPQTMLPLAPVTLLATGPGDLGAQTLALTGQGLAPLGVDLDGL